MKGSKKKSVGGPSQVYSLVTDRIVSLLEEGTVPWRKSWRSSSSGLPRSFSSGKPYRGINVFLLGFAPFSSPYWVTFRGARKAGGSVKSGEKGFPCIFWKMLEKTETRKDGTEKKKSFAMLRFYTVFNLDQTEGLEPPETFDDEEPRDEEDVSPIEAAEAIVEGYIDSADGVVTGGGPVHEIVFSSTSGPCYVPSKDIVRTPGPLDFHSDEEYYSTLFHELAHSTGIETRLSRYQASSTPAFGSGDYSREELVAEMTASFLSAQAGIGASTIENSASYIASWIKVLRTDVQALVWAGGKAQAAADYILNSPKKGGSEG